MNTVDYLVKDDDFRKDTLEWGCHVVPSTGLIEDAGALMGGESTSHVC